jgi:hypothetical protein
MERSSGIAEDCSTRSPKKVGQRSAHPKRKSLPIMMPARKKGRKPRQLSMMGTREATAAQLEAAATIAEHAET